MKRRGLPHCLNCKTILKDYRSKRCFPCFGKYETGKNNPMFGKKRSLEARLKTSIANKNNPNCAWTKGKHLSLEHRKNISEGQKRRVEEGKHNWWKGGIYPKNLVERSRFRNTMKKLVLERDSYTCQLCGQKGGILQVDHIQSWNDYVELRFNMDNCRTLCMDCHYQITWGKPMPKNIKTWGQNLKQIKRRALP